MFVSFGWINCIGVFQNYYQENQLRDYSESDVSLIPALQSEYALLGHYGRHWLTGICSSFRRSSAKIVSMVVLQLTQSQFMLFCGPFIGVVFDSYGPRSLTSIGAFLHVFGLMMTRQVSQCELRKVDDN